MASQPLLSRRDILVGAIGVGAEQALGPASALAGPASAVRTAPKELLLASCAQLGCPEAIGRACRQVFAANAGSVERLVELLLADLALAGHDYNSANAMQLGLRTQSRCDFAEGRVAYVDGWMLSVTESRAYALVAALL